VRLLLPLDVVSCWISKLSNLNRSFQVVNFVFCYRMERTKRGANSPTPYFGPRRSGDGKKGCRRPTDPLTRSNLRTNSLPCPHTLTSPSISPAAPSPLPQWRLCTRPTKRKSWRRNRPRRGSSDGTENPKIHPAMEKEGWESGRRLAQRNCDLQPAEKKSPHNHASGHHQLE
jgi:hypothetical protein